MLPSQRTMFEVESQPLLPNRRQNSRGGKILLGLFAVLATVGVIGTVLYMRPEDTPDFTADVADVGADVPVIINPLTGSTSTANPNLPVGVRLCGGAPGTIWVGAQEACVPCFGNTIPNNVKDACVPCPIGTVQNPANRDTCTAVTTTTTRRPPTTTTPPPQTTTTKPPVTTTTTRPPATTTKPPATTTTRRPVTTTTTRPVTTTTSRPVTTTTSRPVTTTTTKPVTTTTNPPRRPTTTTPKAKPTTTRNPCSLVKCARVKCRYGTYRRGCCLKCRPRPRRPKRSSSSSSSSDGKHRVVEDLEEYDDE